MKKLFRQLLNNHEDYLKHMQKSFENILQKNIENTEKWVKHNQRYSELWPNITKRRSADVPADQEKWRGVNGKMKYFSEKAGKGD